MIRGWYMLKSGAYRNADILPAPGFNQPPHRATCYVFLHADDQAGRDYDGPPSRGTGMLMELQVPYSGSPQPGTWRYAANVE